MFIRLFILFSATLVCLGRGVYFQKFFGNAKNERYSCSSLPEPSRDRGLAVLFGYNKDNGSLVAVHGGEKLHFCLEFPVLVPRAILIDDDLIFMFFSTPTPPSYGVLSGNLKGGWIEYPWKNKTAPSRAHAWIVAKLSLTGDVEAATYLTSNDHFFGLSPIFLHSATFSEDNAAIVLHTHTFGNAFPSERGCLGPAPYSHSYRLPLDLSSAQVCEDLACGAQPCNFSGKAFRETVQKPVSHLNLIVGFTFCIILISTLVMSLT